MTLREELAALDAKAKGAHFIPAAYSVKAALERNERACNAYRTDQLVPLPEVEELVEAIRHHFTSGTPAEAVATAIINHMKGKV